VRVCLEITSQTRNPFAVNNFVVNDFVIENRDNKVFACKEVED
jgi:hypothetical protein